MPSMSAPISVVIELHHGDCRDFISKYKDSVDLVVTSPPYDNLRSYDGTNNNCSFDFDTFKAVAHCLWGAVKDGGVVVWVVGDQVINGSETGTSFKQALYFMEVGFRLHDTMIYSKDGSPFPDKTRYRQEFEYMFVFSNGRPRYVNIMKKRNKYGGMLLNAGERQRDGTVKNKNVWLRRTGARGNVWKINSGYGKTTNDRYAYKHPAMFPEELAYRHIGSWSKKGDVVMDPFMGAGTTGKMAVRLNRGFVGMEINEEYFNIAKERIDNA